MSNGEVTTYFMSEEERQAYIAKHPIVPIDSSPTVTAKYVPHERYIQAARNGAKTKAQNKGPSVIDSVDKEELHRRFIAGESGEVIAVALNMSVGNVHYCIKKFREIEPDKWPRRIVR